MTHPTPAMAEGRAQVMHRAMGQCEVQVRGVCTLTAEPEWHHRQSRRTGKHGPENGLAACRDCHAWIHAHPAQAVPWGWIIPTWVDRPLGEVSCLVRGRWTHLTPGGTYT